MPASVYAQALIAGRLGRDRFTALLDKRPSSKARWQCALYGTKLKSWRPRWTGRGTAPLVVLNAARRFRIAKACSDPARYRGG